MVGTSEVILNHIESGCKSFCFPRGTDADVARDVTASVARFTSLCRSRIFQSVLSTIAEKTRALVLHTTEILASNINLKAIWSSLISWLSFSKHILGQYPKVWHAELHLRFWYRCCWGLNSSGIWSCFRWVVLDVSEDRWSFDRQSQTFHEQLPWGSCVIHLWVMTTKKRRHDPYPHNKSCLSIWLLGSEDKPKRVNQHT